MARARVRYDENDRPRACEVNIPPDLAAYLYREKMERGYRDETELVSHIVRQWVADQEKMDWKKVLKEIKRREKEAEGGAGAKAG